MSSQIPARPLEPDARRVAELSPRPIQLAVNCGHEADLGHQYLFFVIPFGSVSLEDPDAAVLRELFTQLALKGYRPVPADRGAPRLTVTCADLQVTAYDYLFFRSLYTRVELSGELADAAGRPRRIGRGRSSESEPRRFAFAPQFARAFERGLAAAVTALLNDLGMGG